MLSRYGCCRSGLVPRRLVGEVMREGAEARAEERARKG